MKNIIKQTLLSKPLKNGMYCHIASVSVRHPFSIRFALLFIITFIFWLLPNVSNGAQYQQVRGLIDLRSTVSDGALTIDQLAALAQERGFEVLFPTDHDRMVVSYGLPPLRNLLKRKEELNSINMYGAEKYLRAIKDAQQKYPGIIIIPGSETAPFYYWSGNPFTGLTANDHEKRILTIGMEQPEDYREMPILHNESTLTVDKLFGPPAFFIGAMILSMIMISWKGSLRIVGAISTALSLILFLNSDFLKTSPFDAYSGDQGIAPYQLVIDYVSNRGGMTFWNYPETKSGVRKLGPIQVSTKPYPGVLQTSKGYTGFSAVYGDNITITEPGNLWDMTLTEYCQGYRIWPTWGIATADYHKEGEDGARLGNYPTVFWVPEKTKAAILKAMQTGKMYACQTSYPIMPRLDEFSISSDDGKISGISGDEISLKAYPRIRISVSIANAKTTGPVKVRLIRAGTAVSTFEGNLPLTIDHVDPHFQRGEKTYYRLDMRGAGAMIVSNPIFVTFVDR
ncbi:MAG: hypothetical protein CSYNP_01124 [Syntrophus sp. SKADARSKE-3]|nr:hypothetical protein [Syntrophus sp. SKADARSKE-3]